MSVSSAVASGTAAETVSSARARERVTQLRRAKVHREFDCSGWGRFAGVKLWAKQIRSTLSN